MRGWQTAVAASPARPAHAAAAAAESAAAGAAAATVSAQARHWLHQHHQLVSTSSNEATVMNTELLPLLRSDPGNSRLDTHRHEQRSCPVHVGPAKQYTSNLTQWFRTAAKFRIPPALSTAAARATAINTKAVSDHSSGGSLGIFTKQRWRVWQEHAKPQGLWMSTRGVNSTLH